MADNKNLNLSVFLKAVDQAVKPLKNIFNASSRVAETLKATKGELGDLNKAQKQLGRFKELKRGSTETAQRLREQQEQVRQLTQTLRTTSGATKRLNQQRNAAIRQAKKLKNQYQGEQEELQSLRASLDRVNGLTGSLSDKEATLARRIKTANERVQRQQAALKKLGEADVGGKFNKMSHEVGRFARRLALGIGAAAGGIFGLANSTASLGDNVAKTADKLGIQIQALQEYRYAAERSGVSTEKFDSSFERFVKRVGEAADGTGAAKKAYKELGLDAEKLAAMNPAQSFEQVADRLSQVDNQTRRVALAAKIFGREGVGMVNMIKDGSAGLQDLAKDARATGYVLTGQAARDAETFKDKLLDAQLSLTGIKNTIGAELMPSVSDLMSQLSHWIRENREQVAGFAKIFGTKLKAAIPIIADLGRGAFAAAKMFGAVISRTADMVGGFENLGAILGVIFAGKAIASIVSFGAAIFKAGSAIVSLSGALPMVAAGMRAVGAALVANPIGIAVASLAGAAYLIYRNWDAFAAFFKDLWRDVKQAFSEGTGAIFKLLRNWNPFGLIYRSITAGLEALGVSVPKEFRSLGSAIVDGIIGGIGDMYGALKDQITGLASSVAGWFKSTLGIRSPSRVFAGYGENTVEGYRQGLARREPVAIKQVTSLGRRLRGAGVGLAAATMPAMAAALPTVPNIGVDIPDMPSVAHSPITFDRRPPLSAAAAGRADQSINVNLNGPVNIHNGRDERDFMALVRSAVSEAMSERDRANSARMRSALFDLD